jgi:hypothetical protein
LLLFPIAGGLRFLIDPFTSRGDLLTGCVQRRAGRIAQDRACRPQIGRLCIDQQHGEVARIGLLRGFRSRVPPARVRMDRFGGGNGR